MDRFTMSECGECYVFDDDRIWHMLTADHFTGSQPSGSISNASVSR
jgi:hypothetical protein